MLNLTSLINAAQGILDKRFDAQLFLSGQPLALLTLTKLLGPLHYYECTICGRRILDQMRFTLIYTLRWHPILP